MTAIHEVRLATRSAALAPESVQSRLDARFRLASDGRVRADVSTTSGLELRGPFRATDTSDEGAMPRYFLRNVTAGLFDGDEYIVSLYVEEGTRVAISPTAAARVFVARNLDGHDLDPHGRDAHGARVFTRIEVAPGGVLDFDAGLTIPHGGSIGEQHIEVLLHPGAVIAISEALAFGRLARGERFAFVSLISDLSVRTSEHKLLFHRRSVIEPARQRPVLEAVTGGAGALATLTLLGAVGFPHLADLPEAYAGVSALPSHEGTPIGYSAMALGRRPEQVVGALAAARSQWIRATHPLPAARADTHLTSPLDRAASIATTTGGHI